MNPGNQQFHFKSASYDSVARDFALPSAEGLRKLALTYKNTLQGKMDLEKFKTNNNNNASNAGKRLNDPRFRRTRGSEAGETSKTKSDTKLSASKGDVSQQMLSASPASSSAPNTPHRLSPRTRKAVNSGPPACKVKSSTSANLPRANIVTKKEVCAPQRPHKTVEFMPKSPSECASSKQYCNYESTHLFNDPMSVQSIDHDFSGNIATHQHLDEYGNIRKLDKDEDYMLERIKRLSQREQECEKTIDFDKYINCLAPVKIKRSQSALTIPFSMPKMSDNLSMCVKCACLFNKKNPYQYETSTEGDGDASVITNLKRVAIKQREVPNSMCLWALYTFGCFCGLFLVSGIAWILSNDLIWNWVNHSPEPRQKSFSTLYTILTYFSATAIFTINIIVGTICKIFVMPRNSVFGPSEDVDEGWW